MDRITRFSLKNSVVIVMAALMVTVGGLWSASQLKRETMPDVSIPIVAVVTPYPGAAPTDVQDKVTTPLEQAISQLEGIENIQSTSSDSVSIVVAQFSFSADMEDAETAIMGEIKGVELPEGALEPTTNRVSMGSTPFLRFAVSGGESVDDLKKTVSEELVPALEAVDGMGGVQVSEDMDDQILITFDDEALEKHGLTAAGVVQQLQASNLSFPVGSVEIDKTDHPIRVSGTIERVEDLEELRIVIYPDSNEMFADAFGQIGEGMGQLGGAVGQLGAGVGQLGGAVGELGAGVGQLGGAVGQLGGAVGEIGTGVGDLAEGVGMQIGLANALQDYQAQLLEAKITLTDTRRVMGDLESQGATATPEYQQAAGTAMALEQQAIPQLTAAVEAIDAQIQAIQQAAADREPVAPTAPVTPPVMPSAPSAPAMPAPSAGSFSAPADMDMEMAEPTIELVTLGELAEITYGEDDGVVSRVSGEPAVLIDLTKTQDANTVDVSSASKDVIERMSDAVLSDVQITYTYDAAETIEASISDMLREGLLGAVFAFIVILIGLRNWRATLISAVSIPLSVVIALLVMKWVGVTMNTMTLGGLTVAIGRVVDDSIVVIENIFNHLQSGDAPSTELVRRATTEVSSAITSSTITTMAVFAPMALVSGIVGKIFTPFALTVAVALAASLLVAVTVVPLLGKWTLLGTKIPPRDERTTRTGILYRRTLGWALGHKAVVLGGAAVIFVASLALIPVIGVGFMGSVSEEFAQVDVEYPAGYSSVDVDMALSPIEEGLAADEDVEFYTAAVGVSNGFAIEAANVSGGNTASVFVGYKPDTDMDAALKRLRDTAAPLAEEGADVKVGEITPMGTSSSSVEFVVTGPSIAAIGEATEMIAGAMRGVDGLENVTSNLSETRPQITVEVDQAAAASHGLNAGMVAMAVRGYVAEQSAGFIDLDGRETEIVYINEIGEVTSAESVADRTLKAPLGDEVRIGDIAQVESVETPVSVLTRNEQEYASVSAGITERDSNGVIRAAESEIEKLDLPEGVEVSSEGVASMMSEAFKQLGLAMLVAIAAVYLVMVLTFGEAIAPLAIMFSLPLAVTGAVGGLFLAGLPLDMPAMIGALMLIGIVTTNAIMLIERVNQKLEGGMGRHDALLDAGANRMRPILMTALTTIMALVPMAAGLGEGAMSSQSLAIVVLGGLTTSTMLTLIVVPVIYDLLERTKERILGLDGPVAAPVPIEHRL